MGLSGGAKYRLIGDQKRAGVQASIGAMLGVTGGFYGWQGAVQIPVTVGVRASPAVAVYARPYLELVASSQYGLHGWQASGAVVGVDLSGGKTAFNLEPEISSFGPIPLVGGAAGIHVAL